MSAISASAVGSRAASSTAGSSTQLASSSTGGSLLPDYTFLSHCIYHNLSKAKHPTSASPLPPALSLTLDVSGIVASFLWSPLRTHSRDDPHSRHWLHGDLTLPHCTGQVHDDTNQHDCLSGELHGRLLRGWRLRAIHGWGGRYANGLGFTYCHPSEPTATFDVERAYGNHDMPQLTHFELEAGERVVQVSMCCRTWMHAIRFDTSHGRQYQIGKSDRARHWQPLLPTADTRHGRQVEALAFMYGVGGHIHNLGVHYQLLSPAVAERVYGSAVTLEAAMARTGNEVQAVVAAAGDESSAVEGGPRQPFYWARGLQLGRVGGNTRQPQAQPPAADQQQQQSQTGSVEY